MGNGQERSSRCRETRNRRRAVETHGETFTRPGKSGRRTSETLDSDQRDDSSCKPHNQRTPFLRSGGIVGRERQGGHSCHGQGRD